MRPASSQLACCSLHTATATTPQLHQPMDVPRLLSGVLRQCTRSPLSLLVTMLRRLRGRRQLRTAATSSASGSKGSKGSKVVIMEQPGRDFKPNNPKWLVTAMSWLPDSLPAEYVQEPPPLTAFKAVAAGQLALLELGSPECREQLFALQPGFCFINHGSYGATYKLALDVQAWFRQHLEQEPVRFMETEGLAALIGAVAEVSRFVGADPRDVVPVGNATSGVNAVLGSLKLGRGDLVLMANTTYPAVRSTVAHVAAAAGAGVVDVQLELADLQEEEALVAAFRSALHAAGRRRRIKLAVLDLIVSFPPVTMPVQRLCALFSEAGVPVLVDGAHSVGALQDLRVPELGCSFFVSTLHKWLCSPKGAAMLWVHPSKQAAVHPTVVSHGYGLGYRAEFFWQGTSDFSAWLAAPACIALQQALGTRRITEHNHGLAKAAAEMLLRAWGTRGVLGIAGDGSTAGMVAIELPWPLAIGGGGGGGGQAGAASSSSEQQPQVVRLAVNGVVQQQQQSQDGHPGRPTAEDAGFLNLTLRNRHSIEVPVACIDGVLWVRISAQVYNCMADYERLRDVVAGMAAAASGPRV